jgi:serine protease Do
MKHNPFSVIAALLLCASLFASAQRERVVPPFGEAFFGPEGAAGREALKAIPIEREDPDSARRAREEVPLMRPDERRVVDAQSLAFNKALEPILADAAKSTVEIWSRDRGKPRRLAYGTVVADGTGILTKWSEIEGFTDSLFVTGRYGEGAKAEVGGVYTDEDLALLSLPADAVTSEDLVPVKFHKADLPLGRFLSAVRPDGKPGAFGVVAVLERNLRESDKAHLGIEADSQYRGEGVRIRNVQPEYGAAEAGLRAGDVILSVNNREISGLQELKNALSNKNPGDKVTLRIETAGKERSVEVRLSNRPVLGQFAGGRLNAMERMGGELNRIRDGFSRVVQSDMKIKSDQVGGPVVDLQGRVIGITMARADRTRTYIMGSEAVMDLLKRDFDTIADARGKTARRQTEIAEQRRAMIPTPRAQGKPRDIERTRRHLNDVERLRDHVGRELDALGSR